MNKPNLFSFATSELSQDAFICWLLSWAKPELRETDKSLHNCAVALIRSFFDKHGKKHPDLIDNIEVRKQDKQIDVLCIVNEKYPILIEDKTGTKNHSGQLVRYLEEVKGRDYDSDNLLPIYFKTQDQASYESVESKGYQPFLRSDFLRILNLYEGSNNVLLDYRSHLQSIEDAVLSFRTKEIDKWNWFSWIGFYLELQKMLNDGHWDYVANPSGGFLGFWWKFRGDEDCEQYLQLEQKKLCFKIYVKDASERRSLRWRWHRGIMDKCADFDLRVTKPKRFGSGQYMTVCIFEGDYRVSQNGVIDLDATVARLRTAENLLSSVS